MAAHSVSATDTLTIQDKEFVRVDAPDLVYYLNANIYSNDSLADGAYAIPCWWRTKLIDLGDVNKDYVDLFKTIQRVILEYLDKEADTNVTISISTDGGITWSPVTKELGTGDHAIKFADFYFHNFENITAKGIEIKFENTSTDEDFQFNGMTASFILGGPWFEVE